MSDIMDDLLEEVELLEQSTEELESANQKTASQAQQLKEANERVASEANLLALETSKTAQSAAVQSHQAAQAAIKQAEALKEQVLELNESNFNWRQAVRNANKEIQSARTSFTIMLVTTVVFCLVALGSIGYLLYAMQKQEAQFKGEVLDMVSTENALLNKKITLKMDELASVIEILTEKVNQPAQAINHKTPVNIESNETPLEDSQQDTHKHEMPESAIDKSVTGKTEEIDTPEPESITPISKGKSEHEMDAKHSADQNTYSDAKSESVKLTIEKAPIEEVKTASQIMTDETHVNKQTAMISQEEYTELKNLIEQVLTEQKSLQSQAQSTASTSGLSPEQLKKLNGISWLVRQQAKTLKAIETRLGVESNGKALVSSNNTVLSELKNLQLQQGALQKQMQEMQSTIKKYTEQPKEAPPYSYKAK